ncbi:MAG TPA: GFA family protein [Gammaproteobacteria bacterium]
MAKGSCLCGKITYEAAKIGPNVTKCHCKICQKTSGSAYGDYTTAPIDSFKWTSGERLLTKYESSPGNFRNFCSVCGTHMPTGHPAMGIYFIQPGTLDSHEPLVESSHMFLRSSASWHKRQQGLAEFQEYPG